MSPDAPSAPSLLAADLLGRVVAARDLAAPGPAPPPWLWHGYIGPGKVTLLTSQWKSGKTTLLSLLLARMRQGGTLAGLPVSPGSAFVVSEECEDDWRPRFQRLGIDAGVHLLCRPFRDQPGLAQWRALIDAAEAMRGREACSLAVFDSLACLLPAHSENSASAMLECLAPLQRLAAAGLAVLLLHHPRKGAAVAGQAARGSGALPGFVDVLIEMGYHARPDELDRRRRLVAFSRYNDTPRHLLLELAADGGDYAVLRSGPEIQGERWPAAMQTLAEARGKLTRQEMLDNWCPDHPRPDALALWRWLRRAAACGLVRQEGTGRRGDPFRYWLPEREEALRPPEGPQDAMRAWSERCQAEALALLARAGAAPAPRPPTPGNGPPRGDDEHV